MTKLNGMLLRGYLRMDTNLNSLEEKVIDWAVEKGITERSNAMYQLSKTIEECGEVLQAMTTRDAYNPELHDHDINEIARYCGELDANVKSEYGDILVTLIIGIHMNRMTMAECLDAAYQKISKRTGQMKDGTFVKDE